MGTSLDSFKPYQAYGGTYDANGNQTSYDPGKAVAGFQPMQQAAQQGIANLQVPGQMGLASDATTNAMMRAANMGYGGQQFGNQYQGIMGYNPGQYNQQSINAPNLNMYQMNGPQDVRGAQTRAAQTGAAPTANAQNMQAYDIGAAPTATAQNATAQNMQAYNMGAAPTNQAAQFQGPDAIGYQGVSNQGLTNYQMQGPNNIGYQGVSNQALTNYQMQGPQQVGTQQFTGDQVGQYMNPYLKQSLDPQLQEIQRQYGITGANQQSAATQAGAFGGSREAIMAAENERNKNTAMNNTISQGYNNAFQNAQQQFNAQQAANLQAQQANQQAGLTTGQANLNAALGTQSLGASQNMQAQLANQQAGLTAAQANQQAGLTTGQANLNAALNTQSLGAGQNMQAQLANQQAGLTAGQFNATNAYNTGLQNAQLRQQSGLANQALQGQYGLQQGQFGQQANAANQAAQNQFGLTNQAAQNQFSLANQALQGQYGLQQGQFGQQANAANQAAQNQFGLANQAMQGQYGLANLNNQQQANLQNAQMRQQANLANQQAGLTTNQANLNAAMGIQGLGAQQNLAAQQANQQTNLATQQAQQQANQFGYGQAANQAQLAAQYGLSANQLNAQQQQFGANYGMNALQAQLAAANQLSGQGQQQLAAQQGIYGLQNQAGAQQQALEQAKINQAMTDYANAQQYPLMQLGTMSNMLRGLPMQASTTNQYAAAPSALSQGIGAAGAYAGLAQAGVIPRAKGGVIKSMAAGGIASVPRYDVGGEVYSDLVKMSPDELKEQAKNSSSKMVKQMAQSLLKQQRPPSMAGGGIIAFARGSVVGASSEGNEGEEEARIGMQERLAQPPAGGGIMGAAPAPAPAQPAMSPNALVNAQRQQAEHLAVANKSLEETMAERQRMKEAMGVGSNQPAEDYRAKIMAERANSEDEAKRQKGMRMAEFFASWGSTPGPLLVAGMSALRKSIPGMIDDEKARKKADRESDKIIYDIDQATRLEKLGRIDEATAIKDKAAKAAQDLNHYILQYQASIEGHNINATSAKEVANINKESHIGAAEVTAKRMAAATAAAAVSNSKKLDEATRAHMAAEVFKAEQAVRATEAQIKKEKAADSNYRTQSSVATQTRGPSPKERQAAQLAVEAADAEWKRRLDDAQEAAKFAKAQLNEVNTRLGYGNKKTDNEPTAAPKGRPSLESFQK